MHYPVAGQKITGLATMDGYALRLSGYGRRRQAVDSVTGRFNLADVRLLQTMPRQHVGIGEFLNLTRRIDIPQPGRNSLCGRHGRLGIHQRVGVAISRQIPKRSRCRAG